MNLLDSRFRGNDKKKGILTFYDVIIMDYKEYLRLKEIAEDRADYYSTMEVKRKNKKLERA